MKIERDGDVIRFQAEKEDGIGLIGGSIAPIVAVRTADEESVRRYWDYCAGIIKPGGHTAQEAIALLEDSWDVEPLPEDHPQMAMQRLNIAMNRFPEEYGEPRISPEMTDEEIAQRILEGHRRRQAASEITDEQLGCRLHGYRIPFTPRNQPLFDEGFSEFTKRMASFYKEHPELVPPPVTEQEPQRDNDFLFVEETDAQVFGSGVAAGFLCGKLGRYIGISAGDITARSHRFLAFAFQLAEDGELLTMQEFCKSQA